MNNRFFAGDRVTSLKTYDAMPPVSRVTVYYDDTNAFTAGDDTGYNFELFCPFATQKMADNILLKAKGFVYQGFESTGVPLPIGAELGDAVIVRGIYGMIADRQFQFTPLMLSTVSSPGDDVVEDEYGYEGEIEREQKRKVTLGSDYYGVTITRQQGLVINRTDGETIKASAVFNSDVLAFYQENTPVFYFDAVAGKFTLTSDVTIRGLVTLENELANGSTTIDGACIKTGTIDAERINLTGAITWGDLDSDIQTEIINTGSTADQAYNIVDSWKYGSTTYIDGGMILADTVRASNLQGGVVQLLNASEQSVGTLSITGATTANVAIDLTSIGALRFTAGSGAMYFSNGMSQAYLDNVYSAWVTQNCYPVADAFWNCGRYDRRWATIYAATDKIDTSDENEKSDIQPLDQKYKLMARDIKPHTYTLNTGTSGRRHAGYVAQDVKALMDTYGLGPLDFAGWCMDETENGSICGLRYNEVFVLKIADLEDRIAALEQRGE